MEKSNAIGHKPWDFCPFDHHSETADGPLPSEHESPIPTNLLPTIEYARISEEQQVDCNELLANSFRRLLRN